MSVLVGVIDVGAEAKPFVTQLVVRDGRTVGRSRKMTTAEDQVSEERLPEDWHALGPDVEGLPFAVAWTMSARVPSGTWTVSGEATMTRSMGGVRA